MYHQKSNTGYGHLRQTLKICQNLSDLSDIWLISLFLKKKKTKKHFWQFVQVKQPSQLSGIWLKWPQPVHVVLLKLYCMATETFLIHVQQNYDTCMVKLLGNFIYMYGKRSGPTTFSESHTCTGGSHLSQNFWEHENLSSLSVIQIISTNLH